MTSAPALAARLARLWVRTDGASPAGPENSDNLKENGLELQGALQGPITSTLSPLSSMGPGRKERGIALFERAWLRLSGTASHAAQRRVLTASSTLSTSFSAVSFTLPIA